MTQLSGAVPPNPNTKMIPALRRALACALSARRRYEAAAEWMEAASLHVAAHALRFTAAQEKEHAAVLRGLLARLGESAAVPEDAEEDVPRDPAVFLQQAACSEEAEAAEMRRSADAAREEGMPRIATALERMADTRQGHARRFHQYVNALQSGTLFCSDQMVTWLCLACGQLQSGYDAPEHCSACRSDRGHFIRSDFSPFALQREKRDAKSV